MSQTHPGAESWRERAEQRLLAEGAAPSSAMPFGEAMRLVHELRVHQIELELQNEALREARLEAEIGWVSCQELYDSAPVSYFTLDGAGMILQVNRAGARMLRTERTKLVQRRFAQFLSMGDRLAFAGFLQQGLASEVGLSCEVSMIVDEWTPLRVRLEGCASGPNPVLRVVVVDITELRAAQEQVSLLNQELEARVALRTAELETANGEMQSFCYMISHELRAPLARLEGFSRMLPKLIEGASAERLPHVAQRIEAASLRMREVIDGLLVMTRLTLATLEPEPVDLSRMASELLETLLGEGRPRPAQVDIAPGITALGDRRLLALGLRNLLDNALKFTARTPEASVAFGVTRVAGETVYFIKDNGAGFNPAHAGKLFQPFERLHRQEDFEGTGIGLSIVRRIVEKHHGRVWGEAVLGAGAIFRFTLAPHPGANHAKP